jgi:hypothetical protein
MDIVLRFRVEMLPELIAQKNRATTIAVILSFVLMGLPVSISAASAKQYIQKNLVSDVAGVAQTVNSNLVNPWVWRNRLPVRGGSLTTAKAS